MKSCGTRALVEREHAFELGEGRGSKIQMEPPDLDGNRTEGVHGISLAGAGSLAADRRRPGALWTKSARTIRHCQLAPVFVILAAIGAY